MTCEKSPARAWLSILGCAMLLAPSSALARSTGNDPCLAPVLTALNAAGTRADSLAVARKYETGVASGDACAKLVVGYIVGMTSTPAEDEWRERQRAASLLDAALNGYGDEPRLYLASAMLAYDRASRLDAMRMYDRAMERKDNAGLPLTRREVALIHYNRGLIHSDYWRDWRSYGRLTITSGGQMQCGKSQAQTNDNFTSGSDDNTWLFTLNQLCPTQFDSGMNTYYRSESKLKQDELIAMEASMDSAAAVDSTFFDPMEVMLGEYVYLGAWDKAEPMVNELRRRFPDDYRPWAYTGLILHQLGRDSLANLDFGQALIRMPDSVLSVYDDITPLLPPEAAAQLAQTTPANRTRVVNAFWNSLDPLYVTVVNERKVEHYARVTAAELMFGSPSLREHGWDSFAGKIWIRYGRPINMRELSMPSARAVFWNYGDGQDVTFKRANNYHSYRPTDEALLYANERARVQPTTYNAETIVESKEDLDHQLVRFRGADGKSQLLIYTAWPSPFADSARAALLLFNAQFQPVAEWRGTKPSGAGLRRVLTDVPRGFYSTAVEIWDGGTRRLARMRDTVTIQPDTGFAVSDILLASSIKPLGDAGPTAAREALDIEPLWGSVLGKGQPLSLYWEIYGAKAASDGRAKYEVTVQVEDASRKPVFARLLGGGNREPASKIVYGGNREIVNGRVPEWLQLTSDFQPGTYSVVVTVEDKEGHKTATTQRQLVVR